jgi:hypothetical protein
VAHARRFAYLPLAADQLDALAGRVVAESPLGRELLGRRDHQFKGSEFKGSESLNSVQRL